jgi:hypothetical protein
LDNPGIHCGNDIHGSIQVGIGNPGFPCVRKASFHSRLTIADHGYGQPHEDLLTLTQVGYGVGITIELSEVGSFRHGPLLIDLASIALCRFWILISPQHNRCGTGMRLTTPGQRVRVAQRLLDNVPSSISIPR